MKKLIAVVIGIMLFTSLAMAEYVPLKVSLNSLERMVLVSLLPKEANFANWKIINDLRIELSPTEEELAILDMKAAPEGGINANWGAVPVKEITFGEAAEKIIADALKDLDSQEKLAPEHVSLYKIFVTHE